MIFTIINKLTFRTNEGSRHTTASRTVGGQIYWHASGIICESGLYRKGRRLKNAKEKWTFIFNTSLLKYKEFNSELWRTIIQTVLIKYWRSFNSPSRVTSEHDSAVRLPVCQAGLETESPLAPEIETSSILGWAWSRKCQTVKIKLR